MASQMIDVSNLTTTWILKSFVLFLVEGLLLAFIHPFIATTLNGLKDSSEAILYVPAATVILAYFFNIKQVSRSLNEFFTTDRQSILFFLIILNYLFANYSENLLPKSAYLSNVWGCFGFALLVLFLLICIAKRVISPRPETHSKSDLHQDDPASPEISLTDTQETTYDRLKKLIEDEPDISIALTGDWGTGKTVILNKLKRDEINQSQQTLWFMFYPWAYTSEEALIKDFYVQLIAEIDKKLPRIFNISNGLNTSINRLVDEKMIGSLFSLVAGSVFDLSKTTQDPEDIVAKRISASGLKIIVVIDDLERVSDRTIINRTLQLVHHLKRKNIKSVSFVTAFERQAILEALPGHVKESEKSRFIEKFFDTEEMLPDPMPNDLEKQLMRQIPDPLKPNYVSKALLDDLKSHRAVIRLANKYCVFYKPNESKVDLSRIVNMDDFLVLKHLELKYFFIYQDILKNRHIYTQLDNNISFDNPLLYMSMDEEKANKFKRDHVDALLKKHGLPNDSTETVKSMLAEIFLGLSAALGGINVASDYSSWRKDRRISLRRVLDAALGMPEEMENILKHEKIAQRVVRTLEEGHTEADIQSISKEIVQYAIEINSDGWDASLHILTSELENQNEQRLPRDRIPILVKCLIRAGIELDSDSDVNGRKVHILGQAFYILANELLYSGLYDRQKKEGFVEKLSLGKLANYSRTPYGTLLLSRLQLNQEAEKTKEYLNKSTIKVLRLKTRQHFESYYIDEGHDIIKEAYDSADDETADRLIRHLIDAWKGTTESYGRGKSRLRAWEKKLQRQHPDYFLDRYTMKTGRGTWAFRIVDFDGDTPARYIAPEKFEELQELIDNIETSDKLSKDNKARIKMIKQYLAQKTRPTKKPKKPRSNT